MRLRVTEDGWRFGQVVVTSPSTAIFAGKPTQPRTRTLKLQGGLGTQQAESLGGSLKGLSYLL